MTDKLVLIGKVTGAFGVQGELRIAAYTESPAALIDYRTLLREDGGHALTLVSGRSVKGGVIAKAKECPDKTAADRLRGLKLFVPRSVLPPTDEDEFYLTDLVGLAVERLDGSPLGKIKAVQNFGSGDLLEIDPGRGPSWYLPFTREAVPAVDLAGGKVVADPPNEVSERDA
ncbi:MAG TPA: ribosome maturation factor RimM [Caulobacteraceae bacterium]|nr:ribosome maturation factor RimM [Caulobacteraceae bacterium]